MIFQAKFAGLLNSHQGALLRMAMHNPAVLDVFTNFVKKRACFGRSPGYRRNFDAFRTFDLIIAGLLEAAGSRW